MPERQTLTAFVREAVQREVRRRRLREAAEVYREILAGDPVEAVAMDEWEHAPLASEPRKRRAKK